MRRNIVASVTMLAVTDLYRHPVERDVPGRDAGNRGPSENRISLERRWRGFERVERLELTATESSPAVCFDAEKQIFTISGESYPENTAEFYLPVLAWIKEYFNSTGPEQAFVLKLDISYCNSSSTKVLIDLLYLLDTHLQRAER